MSYGHNNYLPIIYFVHLWKYCIDIDLVLRIIVLVIVVYRIFSHLVPFLNKMWLLLNYTTNWKQIFIKTIKHLFGYKNTSNKQSKNDQAKLQLRMAICWICLAKKKNQSKTALLLIYLDQFEEDLGWTKSNTVPSFQFNKMSYCNNMTDSYTKVKQSRNGFNDLY